MAISDPSISAVRMPVAADTQIILISGLSGSGKSVAIKVLEDANFYCVDNLPTKFLPSLIRSLQNAGESRIGISIDARSGDTVSDLPRLIKELRETGMDVRVMFLEANTDELVKRFSETRRKHPLARRGHTLIESIAEERALLGELSELAHRIDTTDVRPNTLRGWVKDFLRLDQSRLTLYFQSFGFKHGAPQDADMVFDVRMLPNPYYDPAMRPLTGLDQPVVQFLDANADAQKMLNDIQRFVAEWLPNFVRDNRSSLTVAIGCTGGQHRSVYMAEKLAARFTGEYQVLVRHRNR
jgi:RNase adapter protein RapZ